MPFNLSDLYVVVDTHVYSMRFDTELPDEVFTSLAEAEAACKKANESPAIFSQKPNYKVQTLQDRLQDIKDNERQRS